jgi:hypothetical protein
MKNREVEKERDFPVEETKHSQNNIFTTPTTILFEE